MRRAAPRPLAMAMEGLTATIAPATPLARVQGAWAEAAGQAVAEAARPTAERSGVLTVTCTAAVWAQELSLMAVDLLARLNAVLGEEVVRELRCRTG